MTKPENQEDNFLLEKINKQRKKNFPDLKNSGFPDIFPPEIKSYLEKSFLSIGVNYDSMAMALLGNLSIAIGGKKSVELNKGWTEKGVLWIALIGKSGIGKTPILEAAGKTVLDENSENEKRFFTTNATVEAICRLHKDNPAGIGVLNDELSIFLDGRGQYKRGGGNDTAFYLQAWNGKGTNFNDTVKETRFLEAPYIPIVGGIQPDILSKIINDKNNKDGFASRFLYAFIEPKYLSNIERNRHAESITEEERRRFYGLIKSLIQSRDTKKLFSISKKAKSDLLFYHDELDKEALENDELLYSPFRKLKTYSLRLSLILHLISGNGENSISEETIKKVIALTNYFKRNTYRAYDCAYQTQGEIWESKIISKLKDIHETGKPHIEKEVFRQRTKKSVPYKKGGEIIQKLLKEDIFHNPNGDKKLIAFNN